MKYAEPKWYKHTKPKWYVDAAHGWLRVDTVEIAELGIEDEISSYSYLSPDGKYSYLEEDSDATVFIEAYGRELYNQQGIPETSQYSPRSRIRDYPMYNSRYTRERYEAIQKQCTHPPNKLYSWIADSHNGSVLCVGCTQCNTMIRGGLVE